MRVLVANGSYCNALAAVRGLGQEGIEVFVADKKADSWLERQGVAFYSRYCRGRFYYTDPKQDIKGFIHDIKEILRERRFDALLPLSINTVLPTVKWGDEIRPLAAVPFGDFETVARANDKGQMAELAEEIDVPAPRTIPIADVGQALDAGFEYPFVVKARRGAASNAVWYLERDQDLERVQAELEKVRKGWGADERKIFFDPYHLIAQEYIPGDVQDVCLLADHGEVRALLTQKRVKTVSLKGGAGIMNITTDIPVLKDQATRLVEKLGYHGPAQIEFKHDPRDGSYKLLEMNAKFWGTLALSIEAGINFPYLAVLLALGIPFKDQFDYRVGLIHRWRFPHEIIAWAKERRNGAKFSSLLHSPPGKVKTDWRWYDPLPTAQQVLATGYKFVQQLTGERRRGELLE